MRSLEERGHEFDIALNRAQVSVDPRLQLVAATQRLFRRPGTLHVTPYQFVGIELGRLAGQIVQLQ